MSLMNDDGTPRRLIEIGSYELGANVVVVPRAPLAAIEAKLAAERVQREADAEKARLAVMQAARSQGRLRRALKAVFGRRIPR
jgi:hypothetical protein